MLTSRSNSSGPRVHRALLCGFAALLVGLILVPFAAAAPKIAFFKTDGYGGPGHIWTIAPDGSGLKQLTSGSPSDGGPAWSPGRGTIAFIRSASSSSDEPARIMLMRSDGTHLRQLKYSGPSLTTGSYVLAYSPDGRYLAGGCRVGDPNDWAVTVLDLKTRKSHIVCPFECENGVISISWSPDGKRLAASIEYGGGVGMLLVDVAGRRLIKNVGGYGSVSWRPDGKYILASYSLVGEPTQTWLLHADGSRADRLGTDQREPMYSPDGKHYVFVVRGWWGYPCVLEYADGDGSHVRVVHRFSGKDYVGGLAWR